MSSINHTTYQVPQDVAFSQEMTDFMAMLGLEEMEVDLKIDPADADYTVRWWVDEQGQRLHVIETTATSEMDPIDQQLGHVCIVGLDPERFEQCITSQWLERYNLNSWLGRCWLVGPGGVRVEVQPAR